MTNISEQELIVTQADRDAAADIARFYLGNANTLPDELRASEGGLDRHFTLDVLARHRISSTPPPPIPTGEGEGLIGGRKWRDIRARKLLLARELMEDDSEANDTITLGAALKAMIDFAENEITALLPTSTVSAGDTDHGRVGKPTGLSSPTEPQEGLGPSGFDPSRITEMLETVEGRVLEPFIKKAADEFYCQVLETAEDYFRDNLDWNLRSNLELLQSENQRMRTELHAVDRLLGSFGLTNEARLEALHKLDKAKAELIALRYEIAFPRDSDGSPKGGDACGSVEDDSAGRRPRPNPTAPTYREGIEAAAKALIHRSKDAEAIAAVGYRAALEPFLAALEAALPARPISSQKLIDLLDDPTVAAAVNEKGGGRHS